MQRKEGSGEGKNLDLSALLSDPVEGSMVATLWPETWQRFAAAKKQFDPNNVLTPGAGIFS
jgi:FAD/FMN-containing dehydrogenase